MTYHRPIPAHLRSIPPYRQAPIHPAEHEQRAEIRQRLGKLFTSNSILTSSQKDGQVVLQMRIPASIKHDPEEAIAEFMTHYLDQVLKQDFAVHKVGEIVSRFQPPLGEAPARVPFVEVTLSGETAREFVAMESTQDRSAPRPLR